MQLWFSKAWSSNLSKSFSQFFHSDHVCSLSQHLWAHQVYKVLEVHSTATYWTNTPSRKESWMHLRWVVQIFILLTLFLNRTEYNRKYIMIILRLPLTYLLTEFDQLHLCGHVAHRPHALAQILTANEAVLIFVKLSKGFFQLWRQRKIERDRIFLTLLTLICNLAVQRILKDKGTALIICLRNSSSTTHTYAIAKQLPMLFLPLNAKRDNEI